MPANPTLEGFSPVQRRKRSRVQTMATELLRASITLVIAFVHLAQERSGENYGCGVDITSASLPLSPLMAASQLLMKNRAVFRDIGRA